MEQMSEYTASVRLAEVEIGRFYVIERAQLKVREKLGALPVRKSDKRICFSLRMNDDRLYITGYFDGYKTPDNEKPVFPTI